MFYFLHIAQLLFFISFKLVSIFLKFTLSSIIIKYSSFTVISISTLFHCLSTLTLFISIFSLIKKLKNSLDKSCNLPASLPLSPHSKSYVSKISCVNSFVTISNKFGKLIILRPIHLCIIHYTIVP